METKRASKAVRQRKIYYRKKETGLREKPVPSFYSQHFLCPIDGKLCPGGRGPQFIFRPQLGSCGHVVEGVSLSGWSGSLEKLVPAGKNRIMPYGKTECRPGQCGHCDFIPCLSDHHNGPILTVRFEPLVTPDTAK